MLRFRWRTALTGNRAKENSANSSLLALPAEIRHKIFEYALSYDKLELDYTGEGRVLTPKIKNGLSLHRVCRQTYNETALLFLKENMFNFPACHNLKNWAQSLRKVHREAVTQLTMGFRV